MKQAPPRAELLGLPLALLTRGELLDWLVPPKGDSGRGPVAAAYLNAHTVNIACRMGRGAPWRHMDLLYADGMSVVREARRRGHAVPERLSAADYFEAFCWAAAAHGRRVAMVGGAPGLAQRCAAEMQGRVPGLKVVLTHDGYFRPGSAGEKALVAALVDAGAEVVLVGMGSPRQEEFALRLRDEAGVAVAWCVGALFEYYAPGERARAPEWMRRAGLEWAFRLALEPRRLAGRYLLGNAEFLLRARGML